MLSACYIYCWFRCSKSTNILHKEFMRARQNNLLDCWLKKIRFFQPIASSSKSKMRERKRGRGKLNDKSIVMSHPFHAIIWTTFFTLFLSFFFCYISFWFVLWCGYLYSFYFSLLVAYFDYHKSLSCFLVAIIIAMLVLSFSFETMLQTLYFLFFVSVLILLLLLFFFVQCFFCQMVSIVSHVYFENSKVYSKFMQSINTHTHKFIWRKHSQIGCWAVLCCIVFYDYVSSAMISIFLTASCCPLAYQFDSYTRLIGLIFIHAFIVLCYILVRGSHHITNVFIHFSPNLVLNISMPRANKQKTIYNFQNYNQWQCFRFKQ